MNAGKVDGSTQVENKVPDKIQGEGNYDAAREYDEAVTNHARDQQQVSKEAEAARDALDSDERADMEHAEAEGRSHARD